jgi:predicted nucleic acid-binding protein
MMVTISLDSTVVIDIVNGRSAVLRDRFLVEKINGRSFVISTLVLHEFAVGTELMPQPSGQIAAFQTLFGDLPIEPFVAADALEAARLRVELRRAGAKLDGLDVLIAGQARAKGWAIATGNLKHFNRMSNLSIEDWSA